MQCVLNHLLKCVCVHQSIRCICVLWLDCGEKYVHGDGTVGVRGRATQRYSPIILNSRVCLHLERSFLVSSHVWNLMKGAFLRKRHCQHMTVEGKCGENSGLLLCTEARPFSLEVSLPCFEFSIATGLREEVRVSVFTHPCVFFLCACSSAEEALVKNHFKYRKLNMI